VGRYFAGLLLIALGVVFLLETMGFAPIRSSGSVVLILVGLLIAGRGIVGRRPNLFKIGLGLWIGAIGLFSILSRAGVTTLTGGDVARRGWPLLLICMGLSLLLDRRLRMIAIFAGGRRSAETPTRIVGDVTQGDEPWTLDEDLTLYTAVGDLRLDLSTATITPGRHRVEVEQVVGDTLVYVPDTVSVCASGETTIGEVAIFGDHRSGVGHVYLKKEEVVPGSDVELIIEARLRIGDIRIERVPGAGFRV